jgi:hypothetical protein
MASGGQYYNFYYGSNKNACSSSTGSSSSNYSGDGSGSVKGDGGRYNSRIPVTGLSSPRSRLTGGGARNYRLSAGTGTTSWSGSGSNYSDYRNTTTAGSRMVNAVETADAYCSSPARVTSPELGSKPGSANSSLFLTRSDSVSSSGSARSTGTVCDETAASPRERQLRSTEPPSRAVTPPDPAAAAAASPPPSSHWLVDGRGAATTSPPNRGEVVASSRSWIHPTETTTAVHQDNNNAAASPSSQRKNSEKYDVTDESREPPRPGAGGVMLRRGPTSPLRRGRPASGTPAAGGGTETEEDTQSVSTVSGSGIDFFRKFVQRKGGGGGCKECEDQFRREVLIDRLVADSKAVLAAVGSSSSARSSCAAPSSSGL